MSNVITVLKMKLGNRQMQYYTDEQYETYLSFNGLKSLDSYDNDKNKIALLKTVYEVLMDVSNDTDLMRRIGTQELGGDIGEAYSNIEKRLDRLKEQIQDLEYKQLDNNNYGFIGVYRS